MILFASDIHLDASRPKTAEAFFHFLQTDVKQADALYLLGDVFELWIGDDDDDEFVASVQNQLADTVKNGIPIFFMRGNRDFLIGEHFAKRTGVTLIDDPYSIVINNTQAILSHGDSLCTNDKEYQAFRQQSRSQAWMDAVLSKPLKERRELGKQLRAQSKTMSSRKPEDIMDVSEDAVIDLMKQYKAQKIIHGHTHRPNRHNINQCSERIVLGDWDSHAWVLSVDTDWELRSWPIS